MDSYTNAAVQCLPGFKRKQDYNSSFQFILASFFYYFPIIITYS